VIHDQPRRGVSPRVAARLADTRRRILDAARTVVAEQGFAAAQVAVVAQLADVATGSVYRHFPSKAALFAEMLRSVCERELAVVHAIAAETDRGAAERVGDAVAAFTDRALRGQGLSYAVIAEPMDREVDQVRLQARADLAEAFTGLIEEGIAAGEIGEQDCRARGAAIVGAMLEALVAPLAEASEIERHRADLPAEIGRFCQAAIGGVTTTSRAATDPATPPRPASTPLAPAQKGRT
jgi:AcrR family transcriptional regulator